MRGRISLVVMAIQLGIYLQLQQHWKVHAFQWSLG